VANWQHPDAPLREGERLIKRVYEALRNSDHWTELALLITYDEHGGFYDHVTPPDQGVPPPGDQVAANGFAFDRLGVRVPALLISPWSPRGQVVHEPQGDQLTTPTSRFEHTSVIASVRRMLDIAQPLTQRDAWAATFNSLFEQLQAPRTDCPLTLPEVPHFPAAQLPALLARPLNDHQKVQVRFYCVENQRGPDCGQEVHTQADAALFFDREIPVYLERFYGTSTGEEGEQ
jgi:phospholipase C